VSDDVILQRYLNHTYLEHNPTWDSEDAPWKMYRVRKILERNHIQPMSICEVGCGSGAGLVALRGDYPDVGLVGYDIAPDAENFWKEHADKNIVFHVADFLESALDHYDVLLLLDVLEHVGDPHDFLMRIKSRSDYVVIHFPLDLSALSVLRESPLLYVRQKVGHIHFFTKGLALELLSECGFEVIDCRYTGAAFSAPQRGLKSKLFGLLRRLVCLLNKDAGVRLLGGETLMVLARHK
jgi:SAM-dependent methyltransferase